MAGTKSTTRARLRRLTLPLAVAAAGLAVAPSAHAAFSTVTVNFAPTNFATPLPAKTDSGAAYSTTTGMGWVAETSLTKPSAQHNGLTMTRVRDRGTPANDPFKRTFVVAENSPTSKGAWEYAVPNGTYKVTVLEGDTVAGDSTYAAEVEGVQLIAPTTRPLPDPTGNPFVEATGTYTVNDNRLTVSAVNGSQAKFNRIIIEDGADHDPPAKPTQLVATAGVGQISLDWNPNTEDDLASYRVYRSTSPISASNPGTLVASPSGEFYNDINAIPGTLYHYAVAAADTSGNLSPVSDEATATATAPATTFSLKVDFTKAGTAAVSPYQPDTGAAFLASRGFGWVAQGTHTPLDATSRSRVRTSPKDPDARLNTLVQMFSTTAPTTPGAWEAVVPNGCFAVTVGAGDPAAFDSRYRINVNGTSAVNFDATSTLRSKSGTVNIKVTDGLITIDNAGTPDPFQGKLQYVDINATACPDDDPHPLAPGNVKAVGDQAGIHVTWAAVPDTDLAGYLVYRSPDTDVANHGILLTNSPVTRTSYDDPSAATATQYYYAVVAIDNASQVSEYSNPTYAVRPVQKVDFKFDMADNTQPPPGYVRDYGLPYLSSRGPGYGWVTQASLANPTAGHVPVSMTSWGRTRKIINDPLLDTFVHMAPVDANGNPSVPPAAWEVNVPDGSYDVTVAIGDAGNAIDSNGFINVEGQNAIADFKPAPPATRFTTANITVNVTDGRLTIDQIGGKNTKLDYVTIKTADAGVRPSVGEVAPKEGATNVSRSRAITAEVNLPNVGAGVDSTLLNSDAVRLKRVSDGLIVAANLNTSAGGDVIVLQPRAALAARTAYRFEVTAKLKDVSGATFIPKSVTFTTGDAISNVNNIARFLKFPQSAGQGELVASTQMGPDDRLYVTTLDGKILRFPVDPVTGTLSTPTTITTIIDHENGPRHIIGLAFDPASTPANPILWVTTGAPEFSNAPDWTGKLTRLSGPDLSVADDYITGLPRSARDHETNSLAFHDGKIYITQGSNSATGQKDVQWGLRDEHLLTGAVLQVDPAAITDPPLDVKTDDGGTYDPYAPGAPVTVYASGIRNAYDLVWHSNGQLYVPTNGSAANGNTPEVPSTLPATCQKRPDYATNHYTPAPLAGLQHLPVQPDLLFRVQQNAYYGHPNPSRCEYVFFGGNPTNGPDPLETVNFPVGTAADPNWRQPSFNFGNHFSPNGAIEYKSPPNVNSALNGYLLVARYSAGDDIIALPIKPDAPDPTEELDGIPGLGGLDNPLDLTEDTRNGNLYVTELSETAAPKITLIKPDYTTGQGRAQLSPSKIVQNAPLTTSATAKTVTLRNTGNTTLTVTDIALTGADRTQFTLAHTPQTGTKIEPDQETTFDVTFTPTSVGVKGAQITATTDDPINPTVSIDVRGLGTAGEGGANEPSLQRILDTYQYGVNAGDDTPDESTLPAGAKLGDEVPIQAFRKAGNGKVTIDPLDVMGNPNPGDGSQAGSFGWNEANNPDDLNTLASIPNSQVQKLDPALLGSLSFDPGAATFGFWSKWAFFDDRIVFSQDTINTFPSTPSHQARGYPLKDATGTVIPNAYVVAFEATSPTQDFQDLVFVVRNVTPEGSGGGAMSLVNQDGGPFPNKLAMNRIGTLAAPPAVPSVHDKATVRIYNSGSTPIDITDLNITGPFKILSPAVLPTLAAPKTLAPGSATSNTFDVQVQFIAESGRISNGALTITSTSALTPTTKVDLAGYWQDVEQGSNEPKLQELATMFGFGTTILKAGQTLNKHGQVSQVGDEIISPYWRRLDTGKGVRITQLAAFHGGGATPGTGSPASIAWSLKGGDETVARTPVVLTHTSNDYQSLLPRKAGSTTALATTTFTPPAQFSFILGRGGTTRGGVAFPGESTDSAANNATGDQGGGCTGACGQHVRIFPAKTPTGQLIAGTYLMFQDYSSNATTNYDYNDNVFLISNIQPDSDADPVLYRVDTGATTSFTDRYGKLWSPDTGLFTPTTAINEPADGHAGEIANTQDDTIYRTYRGNVGSSTPQAQRVLNYRFLTRTATKVNVRLHLVERTWAAAGNRAFDVIAEGQTRIAGVDPWNLANTSGQNNGKDAATTAEIDGIAVTDGALDLSFKATKDFAAIAGIEVFCAETCGSD